MAEQEPVTFSITEDDVTKDYNLDDLPEEGQMVYKKLNLLQQQKQELVVNANFEVEKNDILLAEYLRQLKTHLPEDESVIEVK
jgi:hypothetical protein